MSFFKRAESGPKRPDSETGEPGFKPVQVAYATNQAEAEMIQGILKEEGIPSMVRRNRGFDVPDMLAAGPRDIVVPPSAAEKARQILEDLAPDPGEPDDDRFTTDDSFEGTDQAEPFDSIDPDQGIDPGEPTDPGEAPYFPN